MTFDLFPDVPITFDIGTERVEFGPDAHAQASRRPYLITIRGADGLIRAEWTKYATDPLSAIRETADVAQQQYANVTVTARLQTWQEGWR